MNRTHAALACLALSSSLVGCRLQAGDDQEELTLGEAQQALDETAVSSDADSLVAGSVDLATHFTLGNGVERAASELADFVGATLPCAEILPEDPGAGKRALRIAYGRKSGNCSYRGQTFSGTHTIVVSRNDDGTVEVDHTWEDMSNGRVSMSGTAHVTWDASAPSRHVVHEVTWTRLRDGKTGTGSGDRIQTPLDGDIALGIQVDGTRGWDGPRGRFDLDIDAVGWRWADPLPQEGTYTLTTPSDKVVSLSFSRVDGETIAATLTGPRGRTFTFRVARTGEVSEGG